MDTFKGFTIPKGVIPKKRLPKSFFSVNICSSSKFHQYIGRRDNCGGICCSDCILAISNRDAYYAFEESVLASNIYVKGDGSKETGAKIIKILTDAGCRDFKHSSCSSMFYYSIGDDFKIQCHTEVPRNKTRVEVTESKPIGKTRKPDHETILCMTSSHTDRILSQLISWGGTNSLHIKVCELGVFYSINRNGVIVSSNTIAIGVTVINSDALFSNGQNDVQTKSKEKASAEIQILRPTPKRKKPYGKVESIKPLKY